MELWLHSVMFHEYRSSPKRELHVNFSSKAGSFPTILLKLTADPVIMADTSEVEVQAGDPVNTRVEQAAKEEDLTEPQEEDDESLECIEFDASAGSRRSSRILTSPDPIRCTYKLSGLLQVPTNPTSSKLLSLGNKDNKLPCQKIVQPEGIFISESYYQRVTTLHLSDFIISLPHLVVALQNCAVVETLELTNVFYEMLPVHKGGIDPGVLSGKLWLPRLKKFVFCAKKLANTTYSSEGYTWDMIMFVENNKGTPLTLRNIWQGKTLNVIINTLSMELVVCQSEASVELTLHRRVFNYLAIIPDYFLDTFLRNCRRLRHLQLILPEICAKLDYDALPQELMTLHLDGVVILGTFGGSRKVKSVACFNCKLPEIFLSELHFLFPCAESIKLGNCTRDGADAVSSVINLDVVQVPA